MRYLFQRDSEKYFKEKAKLSFNMYLNVKRQK